MWAAKPFSDGSLTRLRLQPRVSLCVDVAPYADKLEAAIMAREETAMTVCVPIKGFEEYGDVFQACREFAGSGYRYEERAGVFCRHDGQRSWMRFAWKLLALSCIGTWTKPRMISPTAG